MYIYRGAPLTIEEKSKLNKIAKDILKKADVYDGYDYDRLRELKYCGFANYYLNKNWDKTDLENKADAEIYKELITIDEKLGTTMNEQLYKCFKFSLRLDLFEV